jgi:phosphoglycolate phosphatase
MIYSERGALLFDLDGTLTDPAEGITRCIAHALTALEAPVPSDAILRTCIGPPLQTTFADFLGTRDAAQIQRAIGLYRERFAPVGMYENVVYEGIPEALSALREAGFTLFVATAKPAVFAREILRHFGLSGLFTGIYGSELTGERSDKGELIAYLLERENVPAAQGVMLGDRRHDMEGAARCGLRAAIGVTWGYGSAAELRAAGATALCDTPAEMLALLLNDLTVGKG